jgi:hypothetical protein
MREIKFRAWDVWGKKIIDWREIYYNKPFNYDFHMGVTGNLIPLQYTGLKDKNGVEIYEGDIVKYKTFYYGKEKEHIIEVKWEKEATDLFGEPDFIGFLARWEGGEVIGNIYEKPELLDNK